MTFIDLFAGIGGFRAGMEAAGHKCVGFCEKDKYAVKSYEAIYETKGEWYESDITNVKANEMPNADCWCAGFPCQPFSIAGKREGFNDAKRGGVFGEIITLARRKKPQILFLENVKGLLARQRDFGRIITEMDGAGYDVQWQVIDSRFFVPQHRERVYIIGHLRGSSRPEVFPLGCGKEAHNKLQKQQAVFACVTARYKEASRGGNYIVESPKRTEIKNINRGASIGNRIYDDSGIAPTLMSACRGGVKNPVIIQRARGYNKGKAFDIAPTINANAYAQNNLLDDGAHIRHLTPLECWRLQGFSDEAFYKARSAGVSDNQLYRQAGNSVTVPVIAAIANKLKGKQ
ncbi:MAG: DNA cytosine methyltransferase [Helicobacteraceae bacterium]|jgi:DNA (cytosine-5)-methyltransferase 1|nr:DNA cytosine methyltransferase [Helicobacteraceae bacterium]